MKLHSVSVSLIALGLLLAASVAEAQTPVGRASRLTGDHLIQHARPVAGTHGKRPATSQRATCRKSATEDDGVTERVEQIRRADAIG